MAQTYSVKGKVLDNQSNLPLIGAHVVLSYPWSEEVKSVVSDLEGGFVLENVEQGGYKLSIQFLGYAQFVQEITVNQNLDLGNLLVEAESLNLSEVEVTEKLPLATQEGDTTQYNADAFKTLPDATAEELIEKMPGIIVDNGRVQAQGEDVKEVLVDGRPFFGNDPTAALRNLPAEVIDKIQVFDQKSDQANFSGFDDGQTTKTINIITRSNMRTGQFGKVYTGYGYEDKYQLGGNASIFDGQRRISIIGQSNNVNVQNFATEDLLGVVGSSGRRGGFRGRGGSRGGGRGGSRGRGGFGGSSVNDFLVQQQGGIAQTHAFGINYSDKWGKKFDISGSYFFNYSDNGASVISSRAYIDSETANEIYDEDNVSNTQNTNHRLNFRLEYDIDSVNSIIMRPRLSWQSNQGFEDTFGQTLLDGSVLNQTNYDFRSDLSGVNFNNNMTYRRRLDKPGRTISVNLSGGYNDKYGNNRLNSEDIYYLPRLEMDSLDQLSSLELQGWNASTSLNYTEPLSRNSRIMLNYRSSWQEDESDKRTSDFEESTQDYTGLNEQLSNVFSNDYFSHQFGGGYSFNKGRDMILMLRANAQWSQLRSDESFPDQFQLKREYFNILPFAMLRFNFSRQENLRVMYRSSTQNPSVEQLQNVLDNSNPIQLSIGNPELDQAFQHRLFVRYSKNNVEKATVFFFLLSGSMSNNYISNAVYLSENDNSIFNDFDLQRGSQLTRPVNLDGYRSFNGFVTYGIPLTKIKSNLNLDLSGNYSRIPGLVDDVKNNSDNQSYGLGLSLTSNISDRVDFTIASRTSFNNVSNSLRSELNNQYWQQNSKVRFGWIIPGGFVFRTSFSNQLYAGLSEGFDQNYWLWNINFGKKLFKNQRGEINLAVVDLLKQNQSISRNVTEIYIEDVQSQVLQRYIMLNFIYNFRNFNTGKQLPNQPSREERRRRWMRW